jgi:predicted metalloprotease with PDZ domain
VAGKTEDSARHWYHQSMARRIVLTFALAALLRAAAPIELTVDATDVTRRLLHAKLTMPVTPGAARLAYPKWIPGEHMPSGPITDVANLKITGGGRTLAWRRDPAEVFIITVDVPAGVNSIDVTFDFISPPEQGSFSAGPSVTSQLAMMSWNQVLMYPAGTPSDQLDFKTTLKLPQGWKYATALPIAKESGNTIEFQPASLTTVIDSPVLSGRNFRSVDLSPGSATPHYLNMASDNPAALEISEDHIGQIRNLVKESGALYGSRHYRDYHFLVTLSDHVAHFGLEHHESSDDRIPEMSFVEGDLWRNAGSLLPHEMTHSWNGKFRRPAGLATGDYEKPMLGDLLWVYEGLTNYLGEVLAARSGIWSAEDYRQRLALTASQMDGTPGRSWRPLEDTAVAAQLLYESRGDYSNVRRSTDFYPEGSLIWLEADIVIRRESRGAKSLDNFIQSFHGGPGGKPELKPFTAEEMYAALNAVQPYDWRGFFRQRVYDVSARAPLGGITGGGWKLVYREELSQMQKSEEASNKFIDLQSSAGLSLGENGSIGDVIAGSPADRAGLSPGPKILAVNGRSFSRAVIRAAIKEAKNSSAPIELLVKDGDFYRTLRMDCHTGERYPDLERDASQPDLLSEIIKSHAP